MSTPPVNAYFQWFLKAISNRNTPADEKLNRLRMGARHPMRCASTGWTRSPAECSELLHGRQALLVSWAPLQIHPWETAAPSTPAAAQTPSVSDNIFARLLDLHGLDLAPQRLLVVLNPFQ